MSKLFYSNPFYDNIRLSGMLPLLEANGKFFLIYPIFYSILRQGFSLTKLANNIERYNC